MNKLILMASRPKIAAISLLMSVLALILCLLMIFKFGGQPRIAFVRSDELVYGYTGMKEAHENFQKKVQQWQANQKILEDDYQIAVTKYKKAENALSVNEKRSEEARITGMQQNIEQYSNNIANLMKEEDTKMTQSVLNQINSFIQDFAIKNGYDMVMGTTNSGNLLYGGKKFDITDQVLKELNGYYSGQSGK